MKFIKNFILVLLCLFPISNVFGNPVTYVQQISVDHGDSSALGAIRFNNDGSKMFTLYQGHDDAGGDEGDEFYRYINEYNLSTPFDISTSSYAGNSERCHLVHDEGAHTNNRYFDFQFSSDGMKIFTAQSATSTGADDDDIFRFDLTSSYDISTCSFKHGTENLDSATLQNQSTQAGSRGADTNANRSAHRVQGVEINPDGTKIYIVYHGTTSVREYNLSTPYDLTSSSISQDTSGGFEFETNNVNLNPMNITFSADGKRMFFVDHNNDQRKVNQFSLTNPYDTSSYTLDGSRKISTMGATDANSPRGIEFSKNGMKMYIGHDSGQRVYEYNLACPFNIIVGKCPPITENKDRTAMMEAQIEIAKRTIDHSTDTALNRLKWIRRNKDKQNLTNLNIDLNFNNQMINSLTEGVKTSTSKKKADKKQDIFYWSEGSIVVGRIGDSSIASTKKIGTDAITVGADKLTNNNGIKGLAFRVGRNDVDVGTSGSNLDTDTYNLTYYATSPIKDDTKFLDTIVGIGKLSSNLLTVLDGKNSTADRDGGQLYGTIRIKDEIKKNNFTLIPSGRFDIGHTILGSYKESGIGAIDVQKQHVRSKKIRTGLAVVEDLSSDDYTFKRHGKLEYVANIDRSSDFEYTYVSDGSTKFNETLHTGSLHNFNGEIGIDVIMPNSFSIFLIYERNQELGTGHTDKIHIALGYLPNKKTNYAFNLEGSENLGSEFKISKNINDFEIDFKLNNQDVLKPHIIDTASINLIHKF